MHFTINKKKQQDDCCSFLYVYFFNWACFVFLSRAVIGATKKNSFRVGFATEVDVVQQLHALQKI